MNNDITSDIGTIRLAEVYLNKAEALAMQDRDEEAAAVLKELRDKRFITGTNHEITETGKELIDKIRWERRWELCFEGHRWFDLRRYAVSPKYADSKEIRHACYEMEEIIPRCLPVITCWEPMTWMRKLTCYRYPSMRWNIMTA